MKIRLILLLIALITILTSCTSKPVIVSDTTFALDTIIQIKIYYSDNSDVNNEVLEESFELIRDLENTLSVHIENSELYNIKENAGVKATGVSDITYSIISDSITYSKLTDGLFDITAGPLIDIWAIDPPNGYVPTSEELKEVLGLIDYNKIDLSEPNQVYLEDENMIINLGAIAKGSIADDVKRFLIKRGVTSAFISLGGNILLIGNKPGEEPFSIGVQNPFGQRGAYIMAVSLSDVAFVSSGDYERFFVQDGVEYHHILDTQTGYPAKTNIKQVSIIAPDSQMADALSTSVLLLGIEEGLKLIDSIEGVEAIIITKDRRIYIPDAIRDSVTVSEDQMTDMVIVEDAKELFN